MNVRVFNPYTASNQHQQQSAVYRKHENEKKIMYKQQIREVEHGSFTPLVMSSTGGLGNSATAFYKRLVSMLALKWDQPYNLIINWLCCRLSFSLLCSSIQAIRGSRSCAGRAERIGQSPVDLVVSESMVDNE